MPVEVGAIVRWACIHVYHAGTLVEEFEINREVAMRRVGAPNSGAAMGANSERHFERVMEFYADQPRLGGGGGGGGFRSGSSWRW